ncbi:hypothetical protein [Streptomyces sp. NPDC016845]|uniref:hypothetical protein n=1 Tax=Streptomyces sp. NPDC016845 TaxID=3364972 RepID=UPI00379B605C
MPGLMRMVAEHWGAGLATTLPAKGLFEGHPLDVGVCGGLAHPAAERILESADLVVVFGASMGRSSTQAGHLFEHAHAVKVVDEEPGPSTAAPGWTETLHGDVTNTLQHVLSLSRRQAGSRPPWFVQVGPAADCRREDLRDFSPPVAEGTVDPRRALAEIDRHLPDDAAMVIGNGHCSGFAAAFTTAPP